MDSVPVTLIVSNDYCVDSITKIILINDIFTLFVPNAFSPNGDGVNDEFFPSGLNINCDVCKNFEFMVFDRWGEMIFYSNNNHAKWNGKRNNNLNDVQEDIYVWKVIYTNTQKGNKGEQMGMVTVVR
jgi:gliding motility-associated-like protein